MRLHGRLSTLATARLNTRSLRIPDAGHERIVKILRAHGDGLARFSCLFALRQNPVRRIARAVSRCLSSGVVEREWLHTLSRVSHVKHNNMDMTVFGKICYKFEVNAVGIFFLKLNLCVWTRIYKYSLSFLYCNYILALRERK